MAGESLYPLLMITLIVLLYLLKGRTRDENGKIVIHGGSKVNQSIDT